MINEIQTSEKKTVVPEKFLDPKTGDINVDTLLQSYLALEKKLSSVMSSGVQQQGGLKESSIKNGKGQDDYDLNLDHGFFEKDTELNKQMRQRGFTQEQAQFVYDMAAEKLIPMVVEVGREFESERELERLEGHFGGASRYQEIARQITQWGQKNLSKDVLNTMSSTFDGVIALYKMMQNDEPKAIQENSIEENSSESELNSLLKDPKYWRDRDPAYIKKVTEAFKNFYGKKA